MYLSKKFLLISKNDCLPNKSESKIVINIITVECGYTDAPGPTPPKSIETLKTKPTAICLSEKLFFDPDFIRFEEG